MKKSPVVHFEMPYKDGAKAVEFYSKVFGWDIQMMGEQMGNYILAGTTDTENMKSTKPGEINGGFFPSNDQNNKYPLVTIQVDDIEQAMKEVKEAGGEVLGEPAEIPMVGRYVAIHDSEGNRVSLLQPAQ